MSAMSLAIHKSEVYCLGSIEGSILLAKLPFGPETKFEARMIAVAPFGIENCEKLRLCFPTSMDDPFVIIAHATSFLRKDGRMGGNAQCPMVSTVKEKDMQEWVEFVNLEDPLDCEASRPPTPKAQIENRDIEEKVIENNPELRMIEGPKEDVVRDDAADQGVPCNSNSLEHDLPARHSETLGNTELDIASERKGDSTQPTHSALMADLQENSERGFHGNDPIFSEVDRVPKMGGNGNILQHATTIGENNGDASSNSFVCQDLERSAASDHQPTANGSSADTMSNSTPIGDSDSPDNTGEIEQHATMTENTLDTITNDVIAEDPDKASNQSPRDGAQHATTIENNANTHAVTEESKMSNPEPRRSVDVSTSQPRDTEEKMDDLSGIDHIRRHRTGRDYGVPIGMLVTSGVLILSYLMYKWM